jgi:hypothetical protein
MYKLRKSHLKIVERLVTTINSAGLDSHFIIIFAQSNCMGMFYGSSALLCFDDYERFLFGHASILLPDALAIFLGRYAHILLEVFAEKRLGGEVEAVGNLLDAHVGVFQYVTGIADDGIRNPTERRHSRFLFDDVGEITVRQALLVGIESHVALAAVIVGEGNHEVLKHGVVAVVGLLVGGQTGSANVQHFEAKSLCYRLDKLRENYSLIVSDVGTVFCSPSSRTSR